MERRNFIRLIAASSLATTTNGNTADRPLTVSQQEGPYYPVHPIALQNNLLINEDHGGDELQLSGAVVNRQGAPIANARVEIWQCDAAGVYLHPAEPRTETFDRNFRGSGATITSAMGHYQFRTILPVPYSGRPPHIHTKIFFASREMLTSQIYLSDHDGHRRLKMDPVARENSVYTATFDFVV